MTTLADPLIVAMNAERLKQGLTPEEWALAAGVSRPTVYRLIAGGKPGQYPIIRDLAAVVGLEMYVRPKVVPPQACVCSDSVRSRTGTCPAPGDREYYSCPQRADLEATS